MEKAIIEGPDADYKFLVTGVTNQIYSDFIEYMDNSDCSSTYRCERYMLAPSVLVLLVNSSTEYCRETMIEYFSSRGYCFKQYRTSEAVVRPKSYEGSLISITISMVSESEYHIFKQNLLEKGLLSECTEVMWESDYFISDYGELLIRNIPTRDTANIISSMWNNSHNDLVLVSNG